MSEMPEYTWVMQTEDGPSKYCNSSGFGTKYISAEKAKADKLALLSEAEILLRALMQSGDSQQAISHFKQLKQRIEAE